MAPKPKSAPVPAATEKSTKILASRIRPADAQSLEFLEPRIVFSVNVGAGNASSTSLTNPQVNELINGLEDIGKLWNALEQQGALDGNIDVLGTSFADFFNFGSANGQGGFLGDAFRDQLNSLLNQPPVDPATGPTVSQINTWLNTSPLAGTTGEYSNVTWTLNQGGEYLGTNKFEWEVTIGGTKTADQDFVDGTTFATANIDVAGAKVSTTAGVSYKFSFGLTDTGNFFATFSNLDFSIDGAAPSGGVGGTVTYTKNSTTYAFPIGTGSTVTTGLDYTGVKLNPSSPQAADGKYTRLELGALTLSPSASDYSITTTTDSGLQGNFRMTTAGGVPVQLLINDPAILPNNDPTVTTDVALVDYVTGGNITGLFQKIQDIGALLDDNPLRSINIPGIGTALDAIEGLPAFADLLSLRDTVNTYMTTVATPTFNGLTTQVQSALSSALTSAGITLNTFTVTSEFDPATSAMILKVNVDTGNLTKNFEFDRFGVAATQAGLSFDRDETLSISGTVRAQAKFGFGLDLVQAATSANAVFFESGGVEATIKFDATGIDLDAVLGPVATEVEDAEVHATGKLALSVNNSANGRFSLSALSVPEGSPGFIPFDLTPTGTFNATLPLDIKIAGATFTNPQFKFASDNLFTKLPILDTTTANFDKLFNMGKVGPEAILDLIIAVGDWASNFRDSDVFDFNIPFLNADLGSAFDFGLLFTKNLRDHLQDDNSYVALNGDFASFTLPAKAPLLIGNGEIAERIELPATTYSTKAAFITALNTALGANSKFIAEEHGANGVRIAAKDANEVPSFSVLGSKLQLKTIGFVDSSAVVTSEVTLPLPVATDGKIAANAQFTLSIDGAAPVTITVTKTSTDDNTTAANLATDIDTALSTYGIDATAVGNKIKLTKTDGKSFMVTGVAGTSFQKIGLEYASAAGLADLGSTLVSGLTYETLTDMVPLILDELGVGDGDGNPANDPIRASYDVATQTFYLHFEHTFIAPTVTLPVGFNFDLEGFASIKTVDSAGNPSNATLTFTPTLGGSFDFGISLAENSSFEELSITAPTGFAPKGYGTKPDGSPDPYNALAWDGKLAGDASFQVSFDSGVETTLTILKSATDANTTMADLLSDVKAAITTAGLNTLLDARVVAKDGATSDRIEFFTKEQVGSKFQTRNLRIQPTGADKMGFVPDQLELSSAPVLGVSNEAQGSLDFSPGGDVVFSIGLDGGAPVKVTVAQSAMSSNTSMADLLADINTAIGSTTLNGKVKAIRYGLGTQFQLVTEDGTRQLTFSADSVSAQTTLNFGTEKITSRSRGGTFFVKDAKLEASGELELADLNLETQLGFIGITTNGLEGSVEIEAEALLKDSSNNTRFEVGELFSRVVNGSIGDIVQVDFDGTASAKMTGLEINAGILNIGASAEIELTGTNLFSEDGPDFAVTYNGFDPTKLLNFSKASWQDIYEGIKLGVEVLGQTEQFSFLGDTKIPLINLSISEIFTYTDKLVEAIDQLEQDPAGALEQVETRIEELLGIPAENFDLTLDDNSVLRIHLGISTTFSATYGLDFNLAEIAKYTNDAIPADLITLGGFLDASAEGSLQFGAYAGMSLDLGLDFSNGATSPSLIVYNTSGVDLGLRITGQNLNISASLGPVGFKITDGEVIFDGDGIYDANDDGLQDPDFATLHFGPLEDIDDLQGTIDDIAGGESLSTYFGPTFTGVITATLPGSITSDIGDLDLPGPIKVDVEDVGDLFSSDAAIRKDSVKLTLPDMTELLPEIPGLIQLLRNPAILLDGVDSALGAIQRLLSGKSATKLPLLGDQLRKGAGFIDEFRAGFLADLTEKLRGAGDSILASIQLGMFDLFGPASSDPDDPNGAKGAALDLLQDYNGDGSVTKDDVILTFRKVDGTIWVEGEDAPQDQDAIQFNLHLGQSITFGTDLDIDWGLPGLDLDINGSPSITAGWDLYLGFGVSVTDFFYLDSAPPEEFIVDTDGAMTAGEAVDHELSLSFEAVLTSDPDNVFTATGRLFFLQLDAVDMLVDDEYSHVSGAIFVDLTDPGVNNNLDERITIREIFSRGSVSPISAGLEAEAIVNLSLAASVGGSTAIPRILADFNLEWNFELGQPVETPSVGFSNVNLDLGSFISDFLKPIVDKVDEIIKPFDPVLNALQTRIPVLSDIMGRDYTVLDLAVQFGKVDRRFVDAVLQIRQLVLDIAALPDDENILIPIGALGDLGAAFSTKTGAKNVNTSSAGSTQIAMPADANQQYRNTFSKATSVTGGGFGFPILQPANAFKLLLGQDATLITYDIPRLTASMSMSRTFPIWGPLVGKFSGSISAYADFAVGFDTKGFNTFKTSGDVVDILDGFYVSDRANADGTGEDVYEAGFMGRIGIGGAINAAIVEAGIEGFFELRADLDLKDPNDDGKIRGSEIIALLTHPNGYGPLNLGSIRLRGDVGARAYVDFWAPFDWYNAWEWEFARLTLFDKTFTAPDVTPTLAAPVGSQLDLNAGPTANKRNFISTSDVGEEYIISGSGKNITVTFTNTGHTQSFTNIDKLVMYGGKGNDRLIIGADVTTAIYFDGGEGDDEFEGGAGNDTIIGGIGNDIIRGGGGSNTLDGGAGADEIIGGSGSDLIIGGLGDDVINGNGGSDTYQFADEWGSDLFDGDQTGSGTFDFTPVTKDLTLNISATGAQGSSGKNFISFDSLTPYITTVKGGSGNDTATVSATAANTNVTIDGGFGSDQYIVAFNALRSALTIADTGSGQLDSDLVKVQPVTKGYAITVNDLSVTGTSSFASFTGTQTVQFPNNNIENLTVDSSSSTGSSISIGQSITFDGEVRLLAPSATIGHSIDAGDVFVKSTGGINIAADVNAHANGDVTILVSSGDITISQDVMSTAGSGFVGDGAGLIHLFTSGGAILTGQTSGQPGRVLAAEGSLLLRGTNGSIGTINTPIYSTVAMIAASTTGSGLINVHESDGVIVSVLGPISGINTTGGILNLFNDSSEVFVNAPITLGGGDGTITTDRLQINADITSPDANLFIRPEGDLTTMAIGDNVTGVFDVDQSEITHIINGFASIQIGLPLGRNLINLGDATFQDVTLIQNPILGGHINQTGLVTVTDGASFTILGSGHTIELDNQVAAGNIDIIDSAVVRQGETVTLQSGGAININFDVDGTAGGADETLILNATNDVTIKGAIGSVAQLGTLNITGGTNIHFEGSVSVKHLILSAGSTFTVDGTLLAEDITIAGIENVTFHSGITLTTGFTASSPDLVSIVFEGQVVAPTVSVTAKQLVDFYQLVDVTSTLTVTTTQATGDIVFRQQVNAHGGDITVQAPDDITFIGPVAGDQLTINTVDALAFQANVELLGALVQTTGTGVSTFEQLTAASANITSAGVILGGITTFTGAAGLVVSTGSGIFSAVNSVSAPNGPLNITSRSITFQSTVAAKSATLNAGETISVVNASSFTLVDGLIANTVNPAIGEIKFSGPVDIGTTAQLNTPRAVTFQSTLAVDGALTVLNSSNTTFGDSSVVASATVNAVNSINVGIGGITSSVGAISLTTTAPGAGNAINALGILDANTAVNITTPRGAAFNVIDAATFTVNAASITLNGAVTTTGATTLNATPGGNITAAATIAAGGNLTITTAKAVTFGNLVTANNVLIGQGVPDSVETVSIGVGGMSAAQDLRIRTHVPGAGNGIVSQGTLGSGSASTLSLQSARGVDVSGNINAGDLLVNGTAITLRSSINAADEVTLSSTGDISVNANLTAGGAVAVTQATALTFGAQLQGGSLAISNTGSATFIGKATLTGAANIAVTGDMTTGAQFSAGAALNISAVRDLSFGGFVSAASVNIGSNTARTVTVGTSGLAATGNVTIDTDVVAVGSGIITNGPVSAGAASTLTLSSVRGIETNSTLSGGDIIVNGSSVSLRSTVNASDDVTLTSTGDISVSANLAALGDISVTQAAALTFGAQLDGASLTIANTASAVFTGKTTIGGPVNIAVTNDMTTNAQFTATGALNISSVRDLTFGGFVSAASVNIGSTTARTVTTGAAGVSATGDVQIVTNVPGVGTGIITNGPITAGAANSITLTSVRGVEVNNTLSASDVNITGVPIIVRSTINAGDDLTLSSSGSISIQSDLTVGDDVIVNQATALSFGAKLTAADLLVSNTVSANFAGEVLLSNTANLVLTGDLTTSASFSATNSITVPSARDITFGGSVASATVNVGSTTARTVTVGAAGVSTTGALTLRSTDLTGGLNINGPLTATSGAVTLAATAAITSTASISGDTIAATSPAISLGAALSADGAGTTGTIALNSTAAGTGTINIGGTVTSTGSLTAGTIAAPLSAAFNAALTIGQDFIVVATEGISTGAQVNVTRDTSFTTNSAANGEVRANGLLSTGRDLLLNTPRNATFIAPVTVGGNATITNAAQLQFDGSLTVTGALTQVAGSVSSRFASISAASIGINSPTIAVTNAVTATTGDATFTAGLAGKVTVGGNTNVAGALSVPRADEVILTGNVTAASINVGATNVRTMTFGTNLVATTGNVTLSGNNGAITVAGSLNAVGALNIPAGTVITLNGAVTAANATIAGGTLVTGNDLTTTTGNLAITSTGDVTVAGKTTVAQSLTVLGSDDVNLAGAVSASDFTLNTTSFLAGGAFSTTLGDANFTTTGNIRIVGLTTVAEDLTITTAKDTTFQGQVSVVESLTQLDGSGNTRFESSTNAADIAVRTNQLIFAGSTLRALTGDMRLESNEIDFFGGTNAVQGNTNLILRPYSFGASIDVGSPTPTGMLDLSDVDLNAIQAGFDQITIGRSEDGTGAMVIGSSVFKNDVAFHAGSITVENNALVGQFLTSQESIEMTARTGSILTNDDIFATDIVMAAQDNITINQGVSVVDFATLTAGTDGTGTITHNGTINLSSPTGHLVVTAGATSGDILITGSITTFDSDFTAVNGIINQTSGLTTSSDILALARDGITLLTSADHISARVTSTGDLNITDTNSDPLHFLDLGSKTDVNDGLFTADGDITVIADQNANAFRLVANGAITIEVGGEVYLDKVSGAPVLVTGTILIDEDRTTNGEEIRFDGNIRLLRDITLTSNGGNITITGRVNGTAGQHYSLTFNAGGGDVTIGNGIGNVTPLEFLQVNDAGTFTLGNASRVEDDIEINADAVVINAPKGTILTTNGGELRFLPNETNASVDIGGPAGGNAAFSLSDSELAALGNGFSRIQLGQSGGNHAVTIESAIFRDDLEINGDTVTILSSSVPQAVNGLSAVNGHDDNDIIINARTSYNQGSHAALTAGRAGNISITADNITLDGKSRGLIRGFGQLLLQPFTPSQPIVLGGTGAGFELSATEFGSIGDTFSQLVIGRADGSHAISIQTSLNFRDNTVIRTPAAGGSVTIGSALAPITIQTLDRADNFRIEAGGSITVDGSIKTVGRGMIELLADFDEDGTGDLLIGQNLAKTNRTLTLGTELGNINLQGENIAIGAEVAADKKAGVVLVKSLTGNITASTNVDGDADGNLTFRHAKSTISTGGIATLQSSNHGGTADLGAGLISALRGVNIAGFESVVTNATKIKSKAAINIEALRATVKAKSAISTVASLQILGNQATGVITVEGGATLSATKSILLDAANVDRLAGAIIKTKSLVIDEI